MRWRPSTLIPVVVVALLTAIIGFGFWFSGLLNAPIENATPTTLTIAKGDGVKVVADKLYEAGYVKSRWHWNFYIFMAGLRAAILEGEYSLDASMSLRDVARLVTTPVREDTEVTVKLLEGWTAKEMAAALEKAKVIPAADFLAATQVTDSRTVVTDKAYGFLADKPATANLEGYLFPDTYRFFTPSTPAQVLKKLLDNFEAKLTADFRQVITTQGRTVYDVVILASIVEAELKTEQDRAMAADLFLRRLAAGIALQSDATVNYVTGHSRLQPTLEDTQVDSPYNTYKYPGLPPGPIGNPGLSSLRGTIRPIANEYFYFLTGPDGKTHFARTYEEHLQNKNTYLP